jgi:hypothetical protein
MQISNNDISWDTNFAKLVEYARENFRLPCQMDGPTTVTSKQKLGKWYAHERGRSSTTARGVCIQGMKSMISILYSGSNPRKLGDNSSKKNRVTKMISELKSIA